MQMSILRFGYGVVEWEEVKVSHTLFVGTFLECLFLTQILWAQILAVLRSCHTLGLGWNQLFGMLIFLWEHVRRNQTAEDWTAKWQVRVGY